MRRGSREANPEKPSPREEQTGSTRLIEKEREIEEGEEVTPELVQKATGANEILRP